MNQSPDPLSREGLLVCLVHLGAATACTGFRIARQHGDITTVQPKNQIMCGFSVPRPVDRVVVFFCLYCTRSSSDGRVETVASQNHEALEGLFADCREMENRLLCLGGLQSR